MVCSVSICLAFLKRKGVQAVNQPSTLVAKMLQAEEAHPAFLTRLRRKPRDSQPLPAMPDHQQGCPRVAPGQSPHREHHQPGAAEHLSPCVRIGYKGPGSRCVAEKGESRSLSPFLSVSSLLKLCADTPPARDENFVSLASTSQARPPLTRESALPLTAPPISQQCR